jgi:hypothetical protein
MLSDKFGFDGIQFQALKRGEMVYAMDQAAIIFDEAAMDPDWAASGAHGRCVGYAMRWMALRAWGQDYHYSQRCFQNYEGPVADGGFAQVPRDHARSRATKGGVVIRVQTVLEQYHVPVDTSRCFTALAGITPAMVLDQAAKGDGIYYFEMRRALDSAHAIVVQRAAGTYRLFDANYGHFIFRSLTRFAEYLAEFLVKTNYTEKYRQSTTSVGVSAVPPRPTIGVAPMLRNPKQASRRESLTAPATSWGRDRLATGRGQADLLGRRAVRYTGA